MENIPKVLLISKPVSPPWNDSSKNLTRDLAAHLVHYRPIILSKPGSRSDFSAGIQVKEVYSQDTGGFAPSLGDNGRVFLHLLTSSKADLWHFFFAPNPRTSMVAKWLTRFRRIPSIQTICSAPAPAVDPRPLMFADHIVVLSKFTEQRLLLLGINRDTITRITPAVRAVAVPDEEEKRDAQQKHGLPTNGHLLVYPGDLEFGSGAELSILTLADLPRGLGAHLVMACRIKTPKAYEREQKLRALARELKVSSSMSWVGETNHIHSLLALADLVMLPSDDLYAKMDLPLVLIEAMSLGRPVLIAQGTPAEELAENRGAIAVAPQREAISIATRNLLEQVDERKKIGEIAHRVFEEQYRPDRMASAYERVYRRVLTTRAITDEA